jgi:hypothetical protein
MDAHPPQKQPWLIEVPARSIHKSTRQQWQDYTDDCERERGLVTPTIAAKLLEVHRSRTHQLLDAGKLTRFHHFEHDWVSCRELMDRLTTVSDVGGRPKKV